MQIKLITRESINLYPGLLNAHLLILLHSAGEINNGSNYKSSGWERGASARSLARFQQSDSYFSSIVLFFLSSLARTVILFINTHLESSDRIFLFSSRVF